MAIMNKEIGRRIAALRKAKGMTQEELAERLNCSTKHVSHAERGVAALSVDLLTEASKILDCTLDYMIKGESAPPETKIPPSMLQILDSSDERMAHEKELLLSYLNMYTTLRGNNIPEDKQKRKDK